MHLDGWDAHNHLQAHRKSPCCLPVDMAGGILDPERDQDPKVDEALLNRDDSTTDSVRNPGLDLSETDEKMAY